MAVKTDKPKKEYVLNVFDVLRNADLQNFDWFSGLSEAEQKEFVPYVVMRWLSNVENSNYKAYYLQMVNEYVNVDFSRIAKHPELIWLLMCVCGSGSSQRHVYLASKKSKKKETDLVEDFIYTHNPSINEMELSMIKQRLTVERLKELAEDAGYTDDEIKNLLTSFKSGK